MFSSPVKVTLRPPRLEHIGIAGDDRGLEKGAREIGTESEEIGHIRCRSIR